MQIPGYTIIRELGRGGMATVYLANQDRLQRQVALKVMNPMPGMAKDFAQRFIKESQIIAKLRHRQIVTIYDFDSYDDIYYFSMEYLPGGTLAERIQEGLSVNRSVQIVKSISQALKYAHERGIVHRDLKPQNIMFHEDGSPVLTDFGIARVVKTNSDTTRLTRFGMAIGSPRYMSPEQITGQPVDSRSDLYSLGIVFYEMLTKELPYQAEEAISLAMMHCKEPIPPLPDEISAFQPILDKLTAKKAEDRFSDGGELNRAIDQVDFSRPPASGDEETRIIGSGDSSRKPSLGAAVSSQRRAFLGVLLLLLLIAVAAYLVSSHFLEPSLPGVISGLPPASDNRPVIAANYEKLAIEHFRVGQLEKSLGLIDLGLSVTPEDERLRTLKKRVTTDLEVSKLIRNAKELVDKEQLEQAFDLIERGLELAPDRKELLSMRKDLRSKLHEKRLRRVARIVDQARELRGAGDFDGSLKAIERGLSIVPDHSGLLALRYDVQKDLRDREQASRYLKEARDLLAAGQLADSLARTDKGLELVPDHAELKRLRGSILEQVAENKNKRVAELVEQARAARDKDPAHSLALVEEGLTVVPNHTQLLSLREELRQEIARRHSIEELYNTARERELQDDLEGSLELVQRGLALDPKHVGLLDLRAEIESRQRQIRLEESVAGFLVQAREQQRLGAWSEALGLVEKGLELMPDDKELQELQSTIQKRIDTDREVAGLLSAVDKLVGQGSTEKGLEMVKRARALAPDNQRAKELEAELSEQQARARKRRVDELLEQAQALEAQKSLQEGLSVAKEGLKLAPAHPELLALRNRFTAEIEKREDIQSLLDECASRFPAGPSLRDTAESAIACYGHVLELDPNNEEAGARQREIADRIPVWIKALLQEGGLDLAAKLFALLSGIDPKQAELPVLHVAMDEAREASLALDLSRRQRIQNWLNALGYAAGDADGTFGTNTRRAIGEFQSAVGFAATGFLNTDVLDVLKKQGVRQLRQSTLPRMVVIEGGCFQMGSPDIEDARDNDEHQHRICVETFRLGEREVTVHEFRRFIEATGYRTEAERDTSGTRGCWALDPQDSKEKWGYRDWANWNKPHKHLETKGDHPVACVSWNDAQAYVEWLSRESGASIRLPTEAEWEYAARAGTSGTRFWGNGAGEKACRFANVADTGHQWTNGFPCDDGYEWVAPVGKHEPSPWGLYDIFGNVLEWTCSDYDSDYSGKEQKCAGSSGKEVPRVLRGGSWYSGPPAVRAAYRDRNYSETRYSFLGFRIAEELDAADLL